MKAKCEKCKHCKLIKVDDTIQCDYLPNAHYHSRPKYCPNFTKKNSNAPTVSLEECQRIVLEEREQARKTLWARIDAAIENINELDEKTKNKIGVMIYNIYVDERNSDKEV